MRLEDALFNWLQIKIVAEARADDKAAEETRLFFEEILREDHVLSHFTAISDESKYTISYETEGMQQMLKFDRELAEQLLADIESNPKYNNE